jgi:hypothetical protein
LVDIRGHRDVEAGLLESLGHGFGVVLWVSERAEGIVGIADDERRAGRRRLRLGQRERGCKRQQSKQNAEYAHGEARSIDYGTSAWRDQQRLVYSMRKNRLAPY